MTKPALARNSIPVKSLAFFLCLTFGLTWGIALLLLLFPDPIFRLFGERSMSHPLFILAVYSPGRHFAPSRLRTR